MITFKVLGKNLTVKEARELYDELKQFFDNGQEGPLHYTPSVPYQPYQPWPPSGASDPLLNDPITICNS